MTTVELSARTFTMPFECPCCGAAPEAEVRVVSGATRHGLEFPYCKRCRAHVDRWDAAGVASAGVMVLAIVVAFVLAVAVSPYLGIAVFVVSAPLAWWLRSLRRTAAKASCAPSCAAPGLALEYRGWSGTTCSFAFASPTYAARFAEANASLIANDSPALRKLLDGYRKARLAVPTPAQAAGVVPPPLTATEWLARIERTEGIVARRVALSRALEMVDEAPQRRELIQTLARIELAPLLAKLAGLTSPAAMRTHLEKVIEHVGADNLSDELRSAELELLRARIKELG